MFHPTHTFTLHVQRRRENLLRAGGGGMWEVWKVVGVEGGAHACPPSCMPSLVPVPVPTPLQCPALARCTGPTLNSTRSISARTRSIRSTPYQYVICVSYVHYV